MTPARNREHDRREGDERIGLPRRIADRRRQWVERLSVAVAICLFAAGWISLQQQADDVKTSRVEGTQQRCTLVAHIVRALNQAHTPTGFAPELRHDLTVCRRTLAKYRAAQ